MDTEETMGVSYSWLKLLKSVSGWDPGMDYLPTIPSALIVYLSVYIVGLTLYQMTKLLVPHPIQSYLLDFIKTMTFCAYPFGHGMIRKYYGHIGYICSMVPVVFFTLLTLPDGDGNPISVWIKYYRKAMPLWKCLLKNIIQIIAGLTAYRLGMTILGLELHPFYTSSLRDYYNQFCTSDLNVSVYVGFLVEFLAVVYDSWFSSQVFTRFVNVDLLMKIVNSGCLVIAGINLTGMYTHPAMATGYTWGCGDTTHSEHILIYWVGPVIGTWVSVHIQRKFHFRQPATKRPIQQKDVEKGKSLQNSKSDIPVFIKKTKHVKRRFFYQ